MISQSAMTAEAATSYIAALPADVRNYYVNMLQGLQVDWKLKLPVKSVDQHEPPHDRDPELSLVLNYANFTTLTFNFPFPFCKEDWFKMYCHDIKTMRKMISCREQEKRNKLIKKLQKGKTQLKVKMRQKQDGTSGSITIKLTTELSLQFTFGSNVVIFKTMSRRQHGLRFPIKIGVANVILEQLQQVLKDHEKSLAIAEDRSSESELYDSEEDN